ncbi:questin oxidase family protein [Streptacidiphilus jiangxiensis]|uniref:Uncharacterized protein n=1 Tax=Streptacidiphilus jiangxiensis TaxID=235985 RepID=A0A1H7TBF1_STRJI|nr:questin oxidase family protein [Streptacidiphilus jiangxiensis]SEL81646.1 hypothetical protein SAMN05414137_113160 [Streptacidiphilus jiangxiensis]
MHEAVTRSILTDAPAMTENSAITSAVAFRTIIPRLPQLTDAERGLLDEWLARATGG